MHEARRRFLSGQRLDMRELAADLGISRATLYRWAGDRERLLGEILWSLAGTGLGQARSHADATADGPGGDWIARFCQHFMEATAGFQPIRRLARAAGVIRILLS